MTVTSAILLLLCGITIVCGWTWVRRAHTSEDIARALQHRYKHLHSSYPSSKAVLHNFHKVQHKKLVVFVALDWTGKIVGGAEISADLEFQHSIRSGYNLSAGDGLWWNLKNVYIAPKFRRKGVATKLIYAIKNFVCTAKPCRHRLRLEVDTGNIAALSLYKKQGFRVLERNYMSNRWNMIL
mmetsp:Transcript_32331/g.54503  ORF Transcript_32331/g.54503 Transcript_32331/m.54503 type:complete len:182 (-) Transcript_32331:683-1228(-)